MAKYDKNGFDFEESVFENEELEESEIAEDEESEITEEEKHYLFFGFDDDGDIAGQKTEEISDEFPKSLHEVETDDIKTDFDTVVKERVHAEEKVSGEKQYTVLGIPVSEEIYKAFFRPVWKESKRIQRSKICRNEKGVRCKKKDCEHCPVFLRDGYTLGSDISLNAMYDGIDFNLNAKRACYEPEKMFFYNEFMKELKAFIFSLEPEDQFIAFCILYTIKDTEIYKDKKLMARTTYRSKKEKMLKRLRAALADYEDLFM